MLARRRPSCRHGAALLSLVSHTRVSGCVAVNLWHVSAGTHPAAHLLSRLVERESQCWEKPAEVTRPGSENSFQVAVATMERTPTLGGGWVDGAVCLDSELNGSG